MGINLGAALGTILVGYLGQTVGWGYGFGLAGIGMLAGLIVFVLGKKRRLLHGQRGRGARSGAGSSSMVGRAVAVPSGCSTLHRLIARRSPVIWAPDPVSGRRSETALLGRSFGASASLGSTCVSTQAVEARREEAARPDLRDPVPDRAESAVLGPVRAGGRVDEPVHRPLRRPRRRAGVGIFQSINPIYIILLAPLFAVLWQRLGQARARSRRRRPSSASRLPRSASANLVLVWGAEAYRRRRP